MCKKRAKYQINVKYRQNSSSFLSYFSANLNVYFTDPDFEEKKNKGVFLSEFYDVITGSWMAGNGTG